MEFWYALIIEKTPFMKKFFIRISPEAEMDIDRIYRYIAFELMSPLTASRYVEGILEKMDSLKTFADMLAPNQRPFLRNRYGNKVRTITYKKMTIVYNIIDDVVFVRCVMAGSIIK
ncbi:hypothetical protein FACS189451_01360 [Bacteroidia bacterium]|nr:hypothetical protein FACS189446_1930 [Bacteroidia bacterium]GHT60745.1 hypothetical protein FACS189451_01360 [Bacteroidia bacterium]